MTADGAEEARSLLLRDARLVGRDGSPVDVLVESGEVAAIAGDITPGPDAEVVDRIIHELEHGEHYAQPALAAEMRRVRDR
jgi:hypothetical protein